jgi:cytochrome c553
MKRRVMYLVTITCVLITLVVLANGLAPVSAAPATQQASPDANTSISDEVCLACHGQPGQTLTLQDGSQLDLYVSADAYHQSIHGSLDMCVQCHRQEITPPASGLPISVMFHCC